MQYLEAGADIICTNTFGGTPLVLNEYDLGTKAEEINKHAVKLAVEAAAGIFNCRLASFCSRCDGSNNKNIIGNRWNYI